MMGMGDYYLDAGDQGAEDAAAERHEAEATVPATTFSQMVCTMAENILAMHQLPAMTQQERSRRRNENVEIARAILGRSRG